ncbi:hypothetical protein V1282_003562 [Nitrobacteraceae bacterium AZCC 2146]
MTTLDPHHAEDLAALEFRYWRAVEATLNDVFGAETRVADAYRRSLSEAPPLQRALSLHDEPLDVAAALTGEPVTDERLAAYEAMKYLFSGPPLPQRRAPTTTSRERDVLATTRRVEGVPMVSVKKLNKFMDELGYRHLAIEAGVAFFALERTASKKPLLRRFNMESLPGHDADREAVYRLDVVVNMLDALAEHTRRRNPASSIVGRIEKIKARLLRTLQ